MIFIVIISALSALGYVAVKRSQAQPVGTTQTAGFQSSEAQARYNFRRARADMYPGGNYISATSANLGAPLVFNPGEGVGTQKRATTGGTPSTSATLPPTATGGGASGAGGRGTGSTSGRGNLLVI